MLIQQNEIIYQAAVTSVGDIITPSPRRTRFERQRMSKCKINLLVFFVMKVASCTINDLVI